MTTALQTFLSQCQARCVAKLSLILKSYAQHPTPLLDAMEYSLMAGGKRVRPSLAYAAAQAVGGITDATDDYAAALECIHTYSLIHDDLPAMDDDDLRRGKPTCHIQFDEATAILAGDALQCLAFEIIAQAPQIAPTVNLKAIVTLSQAAGAAGMVQGQSIDLCAMNQAIDLPHLENMHALKTGALIEASVVLGALSAGANDIQIESLRLYARAIGLAFQVQDDIIDVTSSTEVLGKTQGSDIDRNKPTYVSLLGLETAQEKALQLCQQAHSALELFSDDATALHDLADYIVARQH